MSPRRYESYCLAQPAASLSTSGDGVQFSLRECAVSQSCHHLHCIINAVSNSFDSSKVFNLISFSFNMAPRKEKSEKTSADQGCYDNWQSGQCNADICSHPRQRHDP